MEMKVTITREQIRELLEEHGLEKFYLEWPSFKEIQLYGADLREAEITDSDLNGTRFARVDLTDIIFEDNYIRKDGKFIKVEVIIKEIENE